MMTDEIIIYGASDDLIEVQSTSFKAEEFQVYLNYSDDSIILAVSDGTILRVRYDEDGIWRFSPVVIGSASLEIKQGQDDRAHTDRAILTGRGLRWVVLGSQIAK
jgi:hypothetical protein